MSSALRILAREKLLVYAALNYPGFKTAKHHVLIADKLEKIASGEITRLIISIPPRHGKSLLASEQFPPWALGRDPSTRVISCTYGQALATEFGRKVRNQMDTDVHKWVFPQSQLADDSHSADRFSTTKGGAYVGVGVGGPLTGRGGNIILADDLVKDAEAADSAVQRTALEAWWMSTVRTRLQPGGRIVMIMTRWHEEDIAGILLRMSRNGEGERWDYLHIPAIADEDNDPLGRAHGEALWPEQYSVEDLEGIQRAVGTRVWQALYQGRPSAQAGNMFMRDWWKTYEVKPIVNPTTDRLVISVDCTFKDKKTSDYVAIQVWLARRPNTYLLERIRVRASFTKTLELIRSVVSRYPQAQEILIEDKANGPAVIDTLKVEIPGIVAINPEGGKQSRASSMTFLAQGGNIYLPCKEIDPFIDDFIDEHATFPNGAHDDEVDADTQAHNYLMSYIRGGAFIC